MSKSFQIWDHLFPALFSKDSEYLKHRPRGPMLWKCSVNIVFPTEFYQNPHGCSTEQSRSSAEDRIGRKPTLPDSGRSSFAATLWRRAQKRLKGCERLRVSLYLAQKRLFASLWESDIVFSISIYFLTCVFSFLKYSTICREKVSRRQLSRLAIYPEK